MVQNDDKTPMEDQAEDLDTGKEKVPKKAKAVKKEAVKGDNPETKKKSKTVIAPEDIRIDLSVELGRLDMTAKRLMELAPGDLIDMDVLPENGVDLVVRGRHVGRAELIKIGEKLGVRVIELN